MFKNLFSFLSLASVFVTANGQADYLDPLVAPATVYEATVKGAQNMDFDVAKNMFVAHSGWYQDRLVHYYKFRMFTPSTYSGVISPGVKSDAVPLQKIFIVTTSGDFSGAIGQPIIEFHTQDGLTYSDFMAVTFVDAPANYVENSFKSAGDVMASGATMTDTDIVLNIPVVPTDSTLQHPIEKGDATAPINPVPVFYKGVGVWTYVFEVTDQAAADFFAATRSSPTSPQLKNTLVTGFEIPVVPMYANKDKVSSIPIWHVNQFNRGVVAGNGGGPDPLGMRNVIDMDRPDTGYSPLWQVFWATEVPINYSADEFSNAVDGTSDNGFEFFESPMFVNCPDIGLVGTETNAIKKEEFMTKIDVMKSDSFVIIGSHPTLIMQGGKDVKVMAGDGTVLGTTQTNGMGGYEFTVMKDDIPAGVTEVMVISDGATIRTVKIGSMDDDVVTPIASVGEVEVEWKIPESGLPFPAKQVVVGDSIKFNWEGFHTVFIYPSKDCDDDAGAIEIGSSSGASYTFQEADGSPEGTTHFFVCSVGSGAHCNLGQQVMVTVFSKADDSSAHTASTLMGSMIVGLVGLALGAMVL